MIMSLWVLVSGSCLSCHRFLSLMQYHAMLPQRAEWLLQTSAVLSGCNAEEGQVSDCYRCFSIAAVQMNGPNQCNILYGDGSHVALKTRAVAFRYKLFCAMWIAHARSYLKGIAWKHSSRKEMRMSSFILALNSNQLFKYMSLMCHRNLGTSSKWFYSL